MSARLTNSEGTAFLLGFLLEHHSTNELEGGLPFAPLLCAKGGLLRSCATKPLLETLAFLFSALFASPPLPLR
jgi:hypothetical protein